MSGTTMNKGPLAVLLILSFVWTLGGAGELFAAGPGTSPNKDLGDIGPSDQEVSMMVVAGLMIAILVVAIVTSGDDEEAGETEEVTVSGIEEPAPPMRIDPVLTLGRDSLGAGLAFSF